MQLVAAWAYTPPVHSLVLYRGTLSLFAVVLQPTVASLTVLLPRSMSRSS